MKRNLSLLAALLLLVSLSLAGCSAKSTAPAAPGALPEGGAGLPENVTGQDLVQQGEGFAPETQNGAAVSDTALREAKLIRTAALEIETLDFEAAQKALDALKERCGGYYESASASGGDYHFRNGNRYATYTVRVPKDQYAAFLNAAGDVGYVVSRDETQEDVGERYYDTELRLKTQQTKYDRLLALLGKADKMEDIISLENAIAEAEYQIEQFKTDLRRYDSLVDYATVHIGLREMVTISEKPGEAEPFSARMGKAFSGGLSDFGTAVGNFFVWCAYNLVGVVILLAVVTTGAVIAVKALKKRKAALEPPAQEEHSGK